MGINLAKLLIREDLISVEQIREALERQRELDYGLGESLVDLGYVSESQLVELLGIQYDVPVMNIDDYVVDQDAIDLIPKETACEKCFIPISVTDSNLTIAMSDPSDILLLDDLAFLTGKNIKPAVASERSIKIKILECYDEGESANDASDDNLKQSAQGDKSNVSSANRQKYAHSVDEIITELEQYRETQLSLGDPSSEEEMSGELEVGLDIDDIEGEVAPSHDSAGGTERIESEEHEFDLDIFGEDENGDNTPLPESGDDVIGSTYNDTEEVAYTDSAFYIGPISVEPEDEEEFDLVNPTIREGEGDAAVEECDSEIAAESESDANEENEIIQTDFSPRGENGEDSEHVIGFAPAFEPEEATAEDDGESEVVEEVQLTEEQEVSNDDSVPDSDDALQLEDDGEIRDVSSKREESAYSPFSAHPEDEYTLDDGGDFPGLDTREDPLESVSEVETEQEPFDFSSREVGLGEIKEAPDSSDVEEAQEMFSSPPIFNSSVDNDPRDDATHFVSSEVGEEAPGGLTEEEVPVSGPLELTSSIFGVGEAEELNGYESSSEDQQGFAAPAVDLSGEHEEPASEVTPSPETESFASVEESPVEEEEQGPEPENLALIDSGAERREEPEETEDLPVSPEESSSGSFFSAPIEEPPADSTANSPQAESSVDKPDSEPLEESFEESPVLNSPEIIQQKTNSADEKGSVLVVDGSPTVRKIVSLTLERQGYRVYTAGDSMQALAKLNEVTPDLIFVDVKLPHMDGYQLCKIIKSHGLTKDIPVVMMTSKVGILDKMKRKRAGAKHYITKPFDPKLIIETAIKYGN